MLSRKIQKPPAGNPTPLSPRTRLPRPSLYRFLSDRVSRYSPSHHLSRSSPSPRSSLFVTRPLHRFPPLSPLTLSLNHPLSLPPVSLYRDFQYRAVHVKRRWTSEGEMDHYFYVEFLLRVPLMILESSHGGNSKKLREEEKQISKNVKQNDSN